MVCKRMSVLVCMVGVACLVGMGCRVCLVGMVCMASICRYGMYGSNRKYIVALREYICAM